MESAKSSKKSSDLELFDSYGINEVIQTKRQQKSEVLESLSMNKSRLVK